jgi:peptide/nickel transport system substrate-binding protein
MISMAMLAAACGGDSDTEPQVGGTAATEEGTEAEAAAADPSATFRYGDANGPSSFDPHRSTIGQDYRFFAPVYDRIVHQDAAGDFVGGLAESWEFSEDGLTLTFQIREGATFQDGTPVDAAAIKANLDRGKTLEGSSVLADLADITSIDAPDATTMVLNLAQPNAILPGLLSHRAGAIVSPAAFENPDLDIMPIGAGPYRVIEHQPDTRIVYERYDGYWDAEFEGPQRIELTILPDPTTRLNALRTDAVDATIIGGDQVEDAESNGFSIDSAPGLTYLVLYINRARAEFDDTLVRQAMNHAIDREAIVAAVLRGQGDPAVQPFPEGYFAYNEDYPGDYYEYDPDKARELLAEAGLPDGFAFDMLVTALSTFTQAGEAIQAMLAEVGITANIRQVEAAQTADVFYAQQDGDALVSQWGGRPDPQMTMDLQFSGTGFSNPGRHTTPEFEELNLKAKTTLDQEERAAALRDEVSVIVEEAFQVPIAHDYSIFAFNDRVVEFGRMVTGQPDFIHTGMSAE